MESEFGVSTASLRNNVKHQIDNPLSHLDFDELDRRAKKFAHTVNDRAPDEELFVKAARIAWDPVGWSNDKDLSERLSEPEKDALENEKTFGFWRQPKQLRVAVIALCLSAIIHGWIQSGINGANLTWPIDFPVFLRDNCKDAVTDRNQELCITGLSRWQFAAVNAITYFAASIGGSFLSDPLQSWMFGRRDAILVSAVVCLISLIGAAYSKSWWELLIWRIFVGLGMGAKASITPIFSAEISPSHLRGALVMNWQQFVTLGIFGGFTANLIVFYIHGLGLSSWRWQIASAALPTLGLISLIWTIPQSPRWLLKKSRFPEAFTSMCALRETPLQAAREIFYANAQIQLEAELFPETQTDEENTPNSVHVEDTDLHLFQDKVKRTDYWIRISQLFRDPRTRRASVAALVVMISQQLCGMNILSFYSSVFFRESSKLASGPKEIWMSWAVGLVNFIFTIPAYWLIDTRGRRFLLLSTYPYMAICMLGASLSFLQSNDRARYGLVGTFMFLFVISYSLGQGPVAFAYSSEVFPLLNREVGMSFAVFANLFGAGVLTLFVAQAQFPDTRALASDFSLGQSRLLGLFVGLNFVAFILIFLFVPETKVARTNKKTGKLIYMSLEELNWIFSVRTKAHIQYQFERMQYIWKMTMWKLRCWFGSATDRPPPPKDLYSFKEMEDRNQDESSEADSGSKAAGIGEKESASLDSPPTLPPLRTGTSSTLGPKIENAWSEIDRSD